VSKTTLETIKKIVYQTLLIRLTSFSGSKKIKTSSKVLSDKTNNSRFIYF